ncbi:hypothetical protein PLICRDRAFT_26060 [Plicaturopsis crispa FD-325 SS-3]|nr:hypothetical protein PLICRDRAFT_26060 [Plicaturopsis crispa FD-325 SS-3]
MSTTATCTIEHEHAVDLSDLLQTLTLEGRWVSGSEKGENVDSIKAMPETTLEDASMEDDTNSQHQSDTSESSSSNSTADIPNGCAMLQAVRAQLDEYTTTGGEYFDVIFMHRDCFAAYPPAHRTCAIAYTDIARAMEQRAWRADRDADTEAVTAFRYEAWMIAAMLG